MCKQSVFSIFCQLRFYLKINRDKNTYLFDFVFNILLPAILLTFLKTSLTLLYMIIIYVRFNNQISWQKYNLISNERFDFESHMI